MTALHPATEQDIDELVALARRAWADVEALIDATLGMPLARLATPSWAAHHEAVVRDACQSETAVVAYGEDGTLIGLVGWTVHPPTDGMSAYGEIDVIAVDPRARRQGVGRQLLDHAISRLTDAGVPARALYESAGFTRLPVAQYWLAPSR